MDVKIILKSEHINSHYHLVLKILLNEFIKFINVNTNRVIEKTCRIKNKNCQCFSKYTNAKEDL